MRRFIKNITLYFIIPLTALGIISELLLRNIPNEYSYKKHYLDVNSDSIKVLILGNSHTFYGINPAFLKENGFNAANYSQTLNFDYEILKKYGPRMTNLKCIVIPISSFSLYLRLENMDESWRVCNYVIYFDLNTAFKLTDYSEMLSKELSINIRRIVAYYLLNKKNTPCSPLGWGTDFLYKDKLDLVETGKAAAMRHSNKKSIPIDGNLNILKSMIDYAKSRNIKVILFTPPAFHTYVENLDSKKLKKTIDATTALAKSYPNVEYFNFLTDSTFTEKDFYDADHLDEFGARKLTLRIDSIISSIDNK